MSPLKLALLLRAHSMPRPNQDLPPAQIYAPAMVEAINSLQIAGMLQPYASLETFRIGSADLSGTYRPLLSEEGEALVKRILNAAEDFYKEMSC